MHTAAVSVYICCCSSSTASWVFFLGRWPRKPWWHHQWKHFPRNWLFVWGSLRSPVNSPHKGQWRGALIFSLICVWINDWVNNREAGDLRRYRAHYDVIVILRVSPCGPCRLHLTAQDGCPRAWYKGQFPCAGSPVIRHEFNHVPVLPFGLVYMLNIVF